MLSESIFKILNRECQKGRFIKSVEQRRMTEEDAGVIRVITTNEDSFFAFIKDKGASFNRTSNNEFLVMC